MTGTSFDAAAAESASGQYLVFSKTAADFSAVKGAAVRAGAQVVDEIPPQASPATNYTRSLSATDTSKADLYDVPCPSGYCHLGGPRIPSDEAYGAGVLNIANP